MGHCGLLAFVDGDKAVRIRRKAEGLQAEATAVGPPADGDEHGVEQLAGLGRPGQLHLDARGGGGESGHPGAGAQPVLLLEGKEQRLHQVAVRRRDELVLHLDHGNGRAERAVHLGHLQADDAAADDEQPRRHRAEGERRGGVPDARVIRAAGQGDRRAAGGEDGVGEAHPGDPVRAVHLEGVRAGEHPAAGEPGDPARPAEGVQAGAQLADHPLRLAAQGGEVDLRRAEAQPEGLGRPRLFDHLGRVQQGLGGDAADVQADPAELWPLLDQADFEAQVGCPEGGGVAARSAAEHGQAGGVCIRHGMVPRDSKTGRNRLSAPRFGGEPRSAGGCGSFPGRGGRCPAGRERRPRRCRRYA